MRRFDISFGKYGGLFVRLGRRWLGLVAQFPFVASVPVIGGGTQAESAQGTYIETSDGASPPTYSELMEVRSIDGPSENADELDATHLRSPGAYKEFIPDFKDGGSVNLTMSYIANSTAQAALRAEFDQSPPPTKPRRITFPDGSTLTFDAWVKSRGTGAQVGQIVSSNITLRVVGPVTYTET